MELTLRRLDFSPSRTIGELDVDGAFECYTLEDRVREDDPATPEDEGRKVPGQTAIPAGRYRVRLTVSERARRGGLWSPRPDGVLPLLEDVPGFTGIRIHAGNGPEHTEGCILVGRGRTAEAITQSRPALTALMGRLQEAVDRGEAIWITITNERGVPA